MQAMKLTVVALLLLGACCHQGSCAAMALSPSTALPSPEGAPAAAPVRSSTYGSGLAAMAFISSISGA